MLVVVYAPRLCHKPEVLNETPYTKASSLTTPILIVAGFVVFVTALALIFASYHGAAWGERDQERGLNNRQQIASPVFHRYIVPNSLGWSGPTWADVRDRFGFIATTPAGDGVRLGALDSRSVTNGGDSLSGSDVPVATSSRDSAIPPTAQSGSDDRSNGIDQPQAVHVDDGENVVDGGSVIVGRQV